LENKNGGFLLPFVVVGVAELANVAFLGIGCEHKPISGSKKKTTAA
jgi:hypothetical protein